MQKAQIGTLQFLKAGEDAPKMLDLIDEALHQMVFSIQPFVMLAQDFRLLMGWDNRFNAACLPHRDARAQSCCQTSHFPYPALGQNGLASAATHPRTKGLYTLFQFPYSVGSRRHCAPLWLIHFTASTKRRHACSSLLIQAFGSSGTKFRIFIH